MTRTAPTLPIPIPGPSRPPQLASHTSATSRTSLKVITTPSLIRRSLGRPVLECERKEALFPWPRIYTFRHYRRSHLFRPRSSPPSLRAAPSPRRPLPAMLRAPAAAAGSSSGAAAQTPRRFWRLAALPRRRRRMGRPAKFARGGAIETRNHAGCPRTPKFRTGLWVGLASGRTRE